MTNETLCKILRDNICRLIQSQFELGMATTFWGKEATPVTRNADEGESVEAWAWV